MPAPMVTVNPSAPLSSRTPFESVTVTMTSDVPTAEGRQVTAEAFTEEKPDGSPRGTVNGARPAIFLTPRPDRGHRA